jgi:hypothetical protein
MKLAQAARIFRVIHGQGLEPGDLESVTIEEAERYIWAASFEEFLAVNHIKIYEEVLR